MKAFQVAVLVMIFFLVACQNNKNEKLIHDPDYRDLVHHEFLRQKEIAAGRDAELFGIFNQHLNQSEKEGLEFLYAFMPLSDLAMNDGEYYLSQVRSSLEAKRFFSWGKDIPEDIFLHFVLPYRVNNEYTDSARQVFFAELKDRIKHMDMADAALEVNHWCHEKVVYKSTDERTSGPLTTVRTAFGRCGEESTFTVAAMRAVGIPARQVYTPRWAHTDDNHAWVEVWINGAWHFLGACEPEPALNMGWFAEPVKRALMTHTFVFGNYRGNEEVIEKSNRYARLNLLTNYTLTKSLPVNVIHKDGNPVSGANVEFGLYNYAEFYPIASQYTDDHGFCSVTTGFGDLLVHASYKGISASQIVKANYIDTVKLLLDDHPVFLPAGEYLLNVPKKQVIGQVDPELAEANSKRLIQEDSIRGLYIATFIDSLSTLSLATENNIDPNILRDYLTKSRGNWNEIVNFIREITPEDLPLAFALLDNISEKDFHDIKAEILNDHLNSLDAYAPVNKVQLKGGYNPFILSPRIGKEFVTPWRSFIQQFFTSEQAKKFRNDQGEIISWIRQNIVLDSVNNYYGVPLSPEGMLQLGRADHYSRNVLFVAICRSFGIPARLDAATRRPQFSSKGDWEDVLFTGQADKPIVKGKVTLLNLSDEKDFMPRYFTHYSMARFVNGSFVTLDYENNPLLLEFPVSLSIDTGFYRMITGNRLESGDVFCNVSYFKVQAGKNNSIGIRTIAQNEKSGIIGKVDLAASFKVFNKRNERLSSFSGSKGFVVAIIDPAKEPTKHLMEDIRVVKKSLDQWNGNILFVVAQDKLTKGFLPDNYKDMPESAVFGVDEGGEISMALKTACSIEGAPQWPMVALINRAGEIVWQSEGYRIGLGDQLIKQIKNLEL
ncbi:MAG: transglutaminase-like domain-containing protein [Lentimicrobium sp.]|nr:transglutaminase-like domain-containing protein [Lentimicrobium sp.]